MRKKKMRLIILILLSAVLIFLAADFFLTRRTALNRFAKYENMARSVDTTYGKISYIDKGEGESFLIAPSRFGYPGSDMPEGATVDMQVEAFIELLDKLGIEKTFVTATSAGGAIAQRFALMYPQRCKGLVLYCSGYPETSKPDAPAAGMAGPPAAVCNDFAMWLVSPFFKPLMGMDRDVIKQIMPMRDRKAGVVFDGDVVNKDHTDNYDNYDLRKLEVPVLIIHSEDDKLADSEKAKYWRKEIPDCTSLFFTDGGHLMTGNNEEINRVLDGFTEENK